MRADLHIHTTYSDGRLTPREAVEWAKTHALDVIAITDHDAVGGLEEGAAAAKEAGIRFVNGIELSCYSVCVGYGFEASDSLISALDEVKAMRRARNEAIGQKLFDLGVRPDMDFSADGVGRLNIARKLIEGGYARDVSDAFDRYLGTGGRAYVEAKRLTPVAAVRLLKEHGALVSIAHPKKFLLDKRLELLISGLKPHGLGGLEVNYSTHTDADRKSLEALCNKYGLVPTGGSDYHGDEDKNFVFDLSPRTYRALRIKQ